ncbi:MAG: ROK family protein [Christensenellaceae bacterium]|jgi:glucokinase|nr:ROK family protein [Christensenellaceae bacterium]
MYNIGIDIGGMSLKGGIVSLSGEIIKRATVETVVGDSDGLIQKTEELVVKLLTNSPVDNSQIKAIGLGIPGTIDNDAGIIVYSNNIKVENVKIRDRLSDKFKKTVYLENDANSAALGEVLFGGARGLNNIIFITLGTGVGTGIIVDGKILTGRGGAGAEGGHMVLRMGGEKCTCGRRGCWETYASAVALIRECRKSIDKHPDGLMAQIAKKDGKISGRTAFIAANQGDALGQKVVNSYIQHVSHGIINLVNIFRPDAIIIGGGVSNEGDAFINKIDSIVSKYSYGGARNPSVKVLKAQLLNDAGILGAAALCVRNEGGGL